MNNVIALPTARRPFRISDEAKRVLRANEYPRGEDDDSLSDEEFDDFIVICETRELDPLRRHIYATKRWNRTHDRKVLSVEATIDGLRLTADRTRRYRGQTRTMWAGADGRWVDAWLGSEPPRAAAVGVWREGDAEPTTAVAHYEEFVQRFGDGNPYSMWAEKPRLMLAKCAEALALRKAFPAELGGLYTAEEMDRSDPQRPARATSHRPAADVVVAGIGELAEACAGHGFSIAVAHSLAHLAGSGGEIDKLRQDQSERAVGWTRALAQAGVEETTLLDAVTYAGEHGASWTAAQESFERWVAKKQQSAAAAPAARSELTLDPASEPRSGNQFVPLQVVVP